MTCCDCCDAHQFRQSSPTVAMSARYSDITSPIMMKDAINIGISFVLACVFDSTHSVTSAKPMLQEMYTIIILIMCGARYRYGEIMAAKNCIHLKF